MKKTIILTLVIATLYTLVLPVFATEKNEVPAFLQGMDMSDVIDIEYLDDGSVVVTTLEILSESRATNTKTGKKTKTVYNANGSTAFSVTNTSTFTYTGSSATCTSVADSKNVVDNTWTVTTAISKSGNTGKVYYNGKRYVSGSLVDSVNSNVSISCSNTGVLS